MLLTFKSVRIVATSFLLLMAGLEFARSGIIAKGKNCRIMPVGDSITEGKPIGNGGYRKFLQDCLTSRGYSFTFVGKEDSFYPGTSKFLPEDHTGFSEAMTQPNHEGYGSFRIDQIQNGGTMEGHSAPAIAETLMKNNPDVILMMLGTNDVIQHYDPPGATGYNHGSDFAARMAQRLNQLLSAIFSTKSGVIVILAQITPIADPAKDRDVRSYNRYLPRIVDQYRAAGRSIVLVDQYRALNQKADLSDKAHPNANGYRKMATIWCQALTGATVSGSTF